MIYVSLSIISFLFFFFLSCFDFIKIATGENTLPKTDTAIIKVGRHPDFLRIVFTVDSEELLKETTITLTESKLLKVAFPNPLILNYRKAPSDDFTKIPISGEFIEISKEVKLLADSNFCLIKIEYLKTYKILKISSPPRLVIDLHTSEEKKLTEKAKTESPVSEFYQKKEPLRFIAIDPGHGGYDKGIHDENNTEKEIVLNIAKEISRLLSKEGKKTFLTRKADQRIPIKDRISIVNEKSPDILISIHLSLHPICIIYTFSTETNLKDQRTIIANEVANKIATHMEKDLNLNIKHESLPLPLLTQTKAPALMIELPNFKHFTYDKKNIETLSKIITKGVVLPSTLQR